MATGGNARRAMLFPVPRAGETRRAKWSILAASWLAESKSREVLSAAAEQAA